MSLGKHGFGERELRNATTLIGQALGEDLGLSGDITGFATIPAGARGSALFVARSSGVVCGLPLVGLIVEAGGFDLVWTALAGDGDWVDSGRALGRIGGSMRDLLAVERTALNFVQRLSGVATLTRRFVSETEGTRALVLDTRKTTPGWRFLEKYAVRCGGGHNHRVGLHDMILVKDNHLAWLEQAHPGRGIAEAVAASRASASPGVLVEIEVDSLDQLDQALACQPDIILVDNFQADDLKEALRRRDQSAPTVLLEVSGGVNLRTIRELALTGVDRISVGALTHSAPAWDIGLDYESS